MDFATEIVIWFGSVYGAGCEHQLDDVVVDVDTRLVHGLFVALEPPGDCTMEANPEAYVVAVERSNLLVGSFAVQLDASAPPAGAPEERTIVSVDLSTPGSTAADDEIGFDPDLMDEPWRIDLVTADDTVEVGVPFTYTLRTDCVLEVVGPINDIVWASENDFGNNNDWFIGTSDDWAAAVPDEWASQLTSPYEPVIGEGIIEPDEATLTFTANGHSERFVPAPRETDSNCHWQAAMRTRPNRAAVAVRRREMRQPAAHTRRSLLVRPVEISLVGCMDSGWRCVS